MKFTVSSGVLLNHLQSISRVIVGKPVLPILENILLEVNGNVLKATASDKEVMMEVDIPLDNVEEAGKITIPYKILLDELKEFPEQPINFDINTQTNQVMFYGNTGKYVIQGESASDYPEYQIIDEDSVSFDLDGKVMLEGINHSIFATADNDLRPVMNCILIEMKGDSFTFVASDAHKLVRYRRYDASSDKGEYDLILPKKPATLLRSVLEKEDMQIKLSFNNKMASFVFGNYKMVSTLIEGRFPNYNSVIPQNNDKRLVVDKRELNGALRRVSIVANQASMLVRLDISNNEMKISAQNVDYAMSGNETLNCEYEGANISIGFKSSFLREILSNVNTDMVVLELSNPAIPGLFMPLVEEKSDEDMLMLLMPMQLPVEY